jgi:MFS transporter, YNFM family, putative membrane transport protein
MGAFPARILARSGRTAATCPANCVYTARRRWRRRGDAASARRAPVPVRRTALNPTIFLLAAVAFVVVAVMTVTGPLLPLVAGEFSRTVGQAGIIVTAFAVPYGAFQVVFGPLGDRYGKLRVIALALGLACVFVIGSGLVRSLEGLALMRFCSGLSMAATIPLAMAWIADEVPAAARQPVMGRYVNGLVMGQIAGGLLGGFAAEYFDWRLVFFVLGVACALVSATLWRQAERGPPRVDVAWRWHEVLVIYAGLFRERRAREIILVGTLEGMLIFGVLAYFGAYLRHAYGLDYARIGLVLCAYGFGGMVYAAAVHRLMRLLGERRMVAWGSALLALCYAGLVVAPAWWLCMPALLFAGFGFYLFHNTMQVQATELSQTARGTAVALWVFMLFMGQGVGVFLFGRLIDAFGYAPAFLAAGTGVAALGLWFSRRMVTHAAQHVA